MTRKELVTTLAGWRKTIESLPEDAREQLRPMIGEFCEMLTVVLTENARLGDRIYKLEEKNGAKKGGADGPPSSALGRAA